MAAITPSLNDYDLVLTDNSTSPATVIGLHLAKGPGGVPIFQRFPAQSLSQQQFQTYSEAIFPPQYQGFGTQKIWHAGFGKQEYESKRYLKSVGTDASVKGMIYPSPVVVDMTNSNPTTTGYNMGLETWTTPTGLNACLDNWADVYNSARIPAYFQDTTVYQGGASSVRREANNFTIRHPLGVTAVNNSIITVTVYLRAITTNATLVWKLYNASDTQLATQTDTGTAGAGWVQKTFAYTFTGTVSNPILELALSTSTTDGAWIDTLAITWTGTALTVLTTGTIVKAIEFNSSHYFVSDTGVWKRSAADLVWVGGSPPGITDAFVSAVTTNTGPALVLCRGSSLVYWVMRTNESFMITSGSGNTAKVNRGVAWNGSDYTARNPNLVYKYSDLPAATAGTTYTAQDLGHDFTSALVAIGAAAEAPFFIREGSAFYINSAGVIVPIVSELGSMDNANTGKNSISWRGNGAQTLYMPAGAGASLLAYDAGDVVNVGPNAFAERLTDFIGQIVATASDDEWLYIVQDNTTKIEILKGRYETIDGTTDFRWHPIVEDTYTTVGYAHISSITAKRLYYGGGTALPSYIPLPTAYGDPLNDSNLTFLTAKTHETSWLDDGLPNILKTYLSFTLSSLSLSGTARTVKVEYQLWEAQSWVELGGSGNGTFNTSPTQAKSFAAIVEGRKIRFRFTLNTDASASGLGIIQFTYRYALKPTRLNMFYAKVRVSDHNLYKNSQNEDTLMTYGVVASQLHAWTDSQPLVLTYFDGLRDGAGGFHDGTTAEVKFVEIFPKEQLVSLGDLQGQAYEAPESEFELLMVQLDRTAS